MKRVIRSYTEELGRFVDEPGLVHERQLIKVTPAALKDQAEYLLRQASAFDPMGEWHRVLRVANPGRWERLRFEALLANEYRLAAELLVLYVEDLVALGRAPSLPPVSNTWHEARHDRLGIDYRERAETVLDFQLRNRPALVLALEGATELTIVPRILERMGVDDRSGLIELVDLHGVGGDVGLLARAVAVPRLDPQGHLGARILSPLTALAVAVDPEGRYDTAAKCAKARKGMIDEVFASLPKDLRKPSIEADLEHLLHVYTWGHESFEFAHFTDTELVAAIRRCGAEYAPNARQIRKAVSGCRAAHGNIEAVWRGWRRGISKVALAEELWPVLETKLSSPQRARRLPIVNVLDEVVALAVRVRRVREMGIDAADEVTPRRD